MEHISISNYCKDRLAEGTSPESRLAEFLVCVLHIISWVESCLPFATNNFAHVFVYGIVSVSEAFSKLRTPSVVHETFSPSFIQGMLCLKHLWAIKKPSWEGSIACMAGQGPDPEQLSNFTVAALMDCSYKQSYTRVQPNALHWNTKKWSCMYIKYPLLAVPKLA